MQTVLIVVHLLIVLALIGVVLLQRSEGGLGLGGGGGVSGFMTGRGQANALTRATAILAAGFFATSLVLGIMAHRNRAPTSVFDRAPGAPSEQAPGAPAPNVLDQLRSLQGEPAAPAHRAGRRCRSRGKRPSPSRRAADLSSRRSVLLWTGGTPPGARAFAGVRPPLWIGAHGAVHFHHRRRGFLAWQGSRLGGARGAPPGARLQGPHAQVRPLSQRRSGDDEPVLSTARSTSPTTAPRPTSTSAITSASPASRRRQSRQHHHRAHLPATSSPRSGAATISARPSRSSRTSPTRSRSSSLAGQRRLRLRALRDRRHRRRHREPAVLRGDPPARQRPRPRPGGQRPPDAGAVHPAAGELKTKPTQHSVRELRSIGVQPEMLLCRCDRPIPRDEREQDRACSATCARRAVIPALDVRIIYDVPLSYHEAGLDDEVLARLRHRRRAAARSRALARRSSDRIDNYDGEVTIGVVGKYVGLQDAYKSLQRGAGPRRHRQPRQGQHRVDRGRALRARGPGAASSSRCTASSSPAASASAAARARSARRRFAREREIPFFGICLGMQMACIEAARNLAGIARGELDRVRRDARAGGRPDHRMDERQRAPEARAPAATSAARCGSAPTRRACATATASPTIYGDDRDQRAPPPPLRGQHPLSRRGSRSQGLRLLRHVARRPAARDRRARRTTRGSSASSSTPS